MSGERFKPLQLVQDDGLYIGSDPVGAWSKDKWKLVGRFGDIFTKGMRYKWKLLYIDLFSGSGYARIKDSLDIYKSSSLIALDLPHKYDYYIFCDRDAKKIEALKERVNRDHSHVDAHFLSGDSNELVNEILEIVKEYSRVGNLLPFCFVDPFSLNIHFETIRKLANSTSVGGRMDFLILQALPMDAHRNYENYINASNDKIEKYLNKVDWREILSLNYEDPKRDFMKFLAEEYDQRMSEMGYILKGSRQPIRNIDMNRILYYLSFYSKHERGYDFFEKAKKNSTIQGSLF